MKNEQISIFSENDTEHILGDFKNNTKTEYSYCENNLWSKNFDGAEINCDFSVLHEDLQEIKNLISEIKTYIQQYFAEE